MKTLTLSLGLFFILVSMRAAAEPDTCQEPCSARSRQLKGHTFLFPVLQESAFVTSNVGIREGIARYSVPDVPVGDNLAPLDILLTGVQQTVDLSLGITDWVGLSGFGRGTIITGTNAKGLMASGATVDLAGELGGVLRLLRSDSSGTQLAFRGRFGFSKGKEITLLPLINAIINTPQVTLDEVINGNVGQLILVPDKEMTANGGFYAAQSLGKMFSLQGSVSAEYAWQTRRPFDLIVGDRLEQKTHAIRIFFAIAASLDLYPTTGVPLAVMGEYLFRTGHQTQVGLDGRTLSDSTVSLGFYYSGRANLQLGLNAVATLNAEPRVGFGEEGRQLDSGEPTVTYGQLILRYIW